MRRMIQLVENFEADEAGARLALEVLTEQDGYEAGRILPPAPSKPGWRVQALFQDEPEADGWLPDGMRRVIVLDSILAQFTRSDA